MPLPCSSPALVSAPPCSGLRTPLLRSLPSPVALLFTSCPHSPLPPPPPPPPHPLLCRASLVADLSRISSASESLVHCLPFGVAFHNSCEWGREGERQRLEGRRGKQGRGRGCRGGGGREAEAGGEEGEAGEEGIGRPGVRGTNGRHGQGGGIGSVTPLPIPSISS